MEEERGSNEASYIPFLTFTNLEDSVSDDVKRIKAHQLVPENIPVYGFVYEVKSGQLLDVREATEGRAAAQ